MNPTFQMGEKININKIFFEDSFINLINKLSKAIYEYYHLSISLFSKASNLFPLLDNNISQLILLNGNNNIEFSKYINNTNLLKKEFKSIIMKLEEKKLLISFYRMR